MISKVNLELLQRRIGATFSNKKLLIQALTHRSFLNENRCFRLEHNERLEFLGDAVLQLITTEYLYRTFDESEGGLTSLRTVMVRGTTLLEVAQDLDLQSLMLMSRGQKRDTQRAYDIILTDAVEAIVGALYLDRGMKITCQFVERHFIPRLNQGLSAGLQIDSRERVQHVTQMFFQTTPYYEVVEETGLCHEKKYLMGVFIHGQIIGKGLGNNKNEGKIKAAQDALRFLESIGYMS